MTALLKLKVISNSKHTWNVCGDIKVVAFLLGMQMGYTKYMYFLYLWDVSRDNKTQYKVKEWPPRSEFVVGKHNVQHCACLRQTYLGRGNQISRPIRTVMGDLYWFLRRETDCSYKRKSKPLKHF